MKDLHFRFLARLILAGILCISAVSGVTLHAQPWSVQGSDIEGEEADDHMGFALDVNTDGSIVVTSSPNHDGAFVSNVGRGQVRVLRFDGFGWDPLGASIHGGRDLDHIGTSVSISGDGDFIAIGSADVDGADGTVVDAGQVRLYERSGFFWVQLATLYGAVAGDRFGQSVSLSADGLTLAVGAPGHDAGGADAGQTTVYRLSGMSLTQLGNAINGAAAGDLSGHAVHLSGDAASLAIGSYEAENSTPEATGHVRVFILDNGSWVQKGATLEGDDVYDNFGISVSLNHNGSILAAGSSTHGNGSSDDGLVRVYQWSGSAWSQMGSDIAGGTNQMLGAAVDLDSEGNTMLVGAVGNTSTAGHMRVYEWVSTNWVQQGSNLAGKAGFDGYGRGASISGDGSIFAGGSEQDRGYVRVYGPCENIGIDTIEACDSYTWIDGVTYVESNNTATWTLTNEAGCDSVVTLNLTILESNAGTDIIEACDSYTWIDGVTYTESNNSATWTLTNAAGCDSVVTLNLTILESNTGTDIIEACDSYTWIDGVTYVESNNTATWTLTNDAGCDSVVTLNLTILESNAGTDVIQSCVPYTWIDGITYSESNNTATWTLTNTAGCDSVVTLDLTIVDSYETTDVIQACESYTWIDGVTYVESNNTATMTLTSSTGCDSVVNLDLTISHHNTGTDVISACDSYTWIDGVTYTASNNNATWTLTNVAGCDSVVTLDLTILESTAGTDVIIACDSHTWIDGVTYTASNNSATWTLTNAAGCDSVVTLDLTILESTDGTDVITACDSHTWIDGVTYTESNNSATWTLTNAVGCDSLVTLDLTILNSTASTLDASAQGSYISPSGKTWTESGTYNDTIDNSVGCDSVITIHLTMIPVGIADRHVDGEVSYYPNPVDQELIIEFEYEFTGTMEVLDLSGRVLIQERRSQSLRTRIDTSVLPPGSYLLKLTGNRQNHLLKFIRY